MSRSNSPSWGVSTVGAARSPSTDDASRPRAVSASPSISSGQAGGGDHVADGRLRGRTGAEARTDHQRLEPGGHLDARPRSIRRRGARSPTASTGRPGSSLTPGEPRWTMPAPARWAAAAASRAAPVIPADPATTSRAACHLWLVGRRGRAATCARRRPHQARGGLAEVEADVGHHHRPRQRSSGLEQEARLRAPQRSPCGWRGAPGRAPLPSGRRRRSGCRPRAPAPSTAGRGVLTVEAGAVGGVHHQVGGREPRRRVARRRRPRREPPACRRRRAAARPSAPLLPLPASTTTRRP